MKTTGFLSLYNGLGVTLVGSIPKAGIRFGGNAYCKKLLADDKGKLTMGQQFLAGMGAGTIEAILAVTPMETIKTKLIEVTAVKLMRYFLLWCFKPAYPSLDILLTRLTPPYPSLDISLTRLTKAW